ncbi:hypothetical protein GCM10027277_36660 [Pseudoduganella ginsengisoli]|uniref:histidine kinase n=1 Tax=Pseudoduganella ginsengisoli TaxID=1462440 RepID=A0A6L6PYF5_9BURK|nr:response regulator [Pseudoduganella ginsengisoli]
MNDHEQPVSGGPVILIVDDSPSSVLVMKEYLEDAGYQTCHAYNGEAALIQAREVLPALVLMDVVMPGINGFETCARMKTDDVLKDIPVIFMTSLADESSKMHAFNVGGIDYVSKPPLLGELLARVRTHIALYTLQRSMAEQNAALQREVAVREAAEQALREHRDQLERDVAERTADVVSHSQALEETLARLRTMQEQVIKSETMASLGRVVAGIAHEVNTPLGVALSAASHLNDQMRTVAAKMRDNQLQRSKLEQFFEVGMELSQSLLVNCQRAADLMGRLKAGATDRASGQRREFNLGGYVREVMASLQPQLKQAGIEAVIDADDGIAMDSFPGPLAQILTNLVSNAQDHAFGGKGGRVQITVRPLGGSHVDMVFSDNGAGIAPNDLPRVLDPFFTTRRSAGNSGLGMHIIQSLVTLVLGGGIKVDSAQGQGTTVRLTFPRVAPEPGSA